MGGSLHSMVVSLVFFGITVYANKDNRCHCFHDCESLTRMEKKLSESRVTPRPRPQLAYFHIERDNTTCTRGLKCCVKDLKKNGWTRYKGSWNKVFSCVCSIRQAPAICKRHGARLARVKDRGHDWVIARLGRKAGQKSVTIDIKGRNYYDGTSAKYIHRTHYAQPGICAKINTRRVLWGGYFCRFYGKSGIACELIL